MTSRVLYRGRWYDVPTTTRNDAYCKARDRGLSHEDACRSHTNNWMHHHGMGRLSKPTV